MYAGNSGFLTNTVNELLMKLNDLYDIIQGVYFDRSIHPFHMHFKESFSS